MSRSWKQDRTTPKTPAKNAPRPRVSDFAREYYKGKGYQVETPVDPYCDDGLAAWEAQDLPTES